MCTQKPSHKERQKGQVENKIKVETQVQDEIESLCITINASLQNCFAAPDTKDIIEVQFCLHNSMEIQSCSNILSAPDTKDITVVQFCPI